MDLVFHCLYFLIQKIVSFKVCQVVLSQVVVSYYGQIFLQQKSPYIFIFLKKYIYWACVTLHFMLRHFIPFLFSQLYSSQSHLVPS